MSQEIFNELAEIKQSQALTLERQDHATALAEKHAELLEKHTETLLRLTITVERHEERSTKLEVRQDYLDTTIQTIKDHITRLQGAGHLIKILGVAFGTISALSGVLYGVYQFALKIGL